MTAAARRDAPPPIVRRRRVDGRAANSFTTWAPNVSGPTAPMPAPARDGRPFHALVQLFPDGRCGFAVDDVAVVLARSAYRDRTAHVMLYGNSQETGVRVGPVRVVTGVAPHVRWPDAPRP